MWDEVWGMHRVKWETRNTEYGVKNGIVISAASY